MLGLMGNKRAASALLGENTDGAGWHLRKFNPGITDHGIGGVSSEVEIARLHFGVGAYLFGD